jgi:hypothetical protein
MTNAIRFSSNAALASPSVGDLYLPVFGGQVLTRYSEYLGITAMVRKQQITSGNTAHFPRLGGSRLSPPRSRLASTIVRWSPTSSSTTWTRC